MYSIRNKCLILMHYLYTDFCKILFYRSGRDILYTNVYIMSDVSFTNLTRAHYHPVMRHLAHTSHARIHNINVWSVILWIRIHACLVVHPCCTLHSNIVPAGRSTCRWFHNNNNFVNAAAVYYVDFVCSALPFNRWTFSLPYAGMRDSWHVHVHHR